MRSSRQIRRTAGFTVLELLVASAITAAMAAILIGITSGVLGVWNRSRGSLTNSNHAKIALDQLAADLQGAYFRSDGRVWMAATILESNNAGASETDAQLEAGRGWLVSGAESAVLKPRTTGIGADERGFVLDRPAIEECRFGMAGTWLRFFTTRLDNNSGTDDLSAPAAVSYQVCRRRVGGAGSETAYMLYRSVVRTNGAISTFSAGYDLDPIVGAYVTGTLEGDPGTVMRPATPQIIAHNVIDFGVRLFVREGGTLRLIFPAQASEVATDPVTGTPTDSSSAAAPVPAVELQHLSRGGVSLNATDAYRTRFPDVVEVSIRVLTDEGAAIIQGIEAGQVNASWWDTAEAHSRVFTRRIEIGGGEL